jgi:hypothetical protein
MRHSESIAALAKALAAAQAEYVTVPKSKSATVKMKSGGEFKYNYADLADCLAMALPRLSKHGIAFSQPHVIFPDGLRVVTFLLHESGEWMASDGIAISEAGEPQQFGAESTYFRRYDGCSFIGVAPDEDTDAQGAGKRTPKATPAQATQQPAPEAAQPQVGQLKFIPPNGLTAVIKGVKEIKGLPAKPADGDIPAVTGVRARLIVTLLGQHNGVSEASCFDTKLWPAIKESVGLECHFQIFEGTTASKKPFIRIEDLIYVAGEEYVNGQPVPPPDQQ